MLSRIVFLADSFFQHHPRKLLRNTFRLSAVVWIASLGTAKLRFFEDETVNIFSVVFASTAPTTGDLDELK